MKEFKKISSEYSFEEMYEHLADNVKNNVDFLLNEYKYSLLLSLEECESPIEQILSLHLNESIFNSFNGEIEILDLTKQAEIYCDNKKYRVDFLLELAFKKLGRYEKVLKLVIECDGHEFHEKTKEQVKRDNERARNIQKEGYEILRFSGSEIHSNPTKCVLEIKRFIYSRYKTEVE